MKTQFYNLILFVCFIPILSFGYNDPDCNDHKGKYTKEKTIKKEFSVNENALLKVSNSYGNIQLTSWDQNRVVIEVHIKTNGNSEENVQRKLNEIDVDFQGSPSLVSAKTIFNKGKSKSWWKWKKKNHVNMTINYTIKFPVKNSIDISNDYGGIFLDRVENTAKLSCDYGKMEIGELMAEDNTLSFDYTNHTTIEYMKGGRISADYSSFTIDKAGDIRLNADYTKSRFGSLHNLNYVCDYHSLEVGSANNVEGNGDYLSLRLGDVSGNVDVKADYGSIKIGQLMPQAGNVRIQSDYAGIKIGHHIDYNFSFEINLEYASLKGTDGFEFNKKRVQSSDKYYQGYYGSQNNSNTITITSEYGSVRFFHQ